MFDSLSDRLGDVFDRLRRHGALTEDDVGAALREIRIALLEADVALPVVRDFVAAVREKALGQEVLRSVTPAQMVVKIVHDHLVEVLGGDVEGARADGIDLNAPPPVVVMLVGRSCRATGRWRSPSARSAPGAPKATTSSFSTPPDGCTSTRS